MSSSYPTSVDTPSNFGLPAGTSLVTSPDHAAAHTDLSTAMGSVQAVMGTTSATAALKDITVGKFAVSNNGGTYNNGIVGTPRITGGTMSAAIVGTSTVQGGTVNGAVIGTPTILGPINASGTAVPITMGAALAPNEGTLTDTTSGTLTANAQAANIYYCLLGTAAGNRTIGTPTNAASAITLTYAFKASGSANGTLVWQSAFTFSQDIGTPTLGTGTSWNYFGWRYNRIDSKFHYMGQSINVI